MATRIPHHELSSRIQRFQQSMEAADVDGAIILQKSDLFYFSGTIQQAHLYIPTTGHPLLMVTKHLERAIQESSLEAIVRLPASRAIPDLLEAHDPAAGDPELGAPHGASG